MMGLAILSATEDERRLCSLRRWRHGAEEKRR
jgi:hypothetical protein